MGASGVLTLCDLEIHPSSCLQPSCLWKAPVLGCPMGCGVLGPGGIDRALAEGTIGAGLWVLVVQKRTVQGV